MGRQPLAVGGPADAADFRQELLGRLGLGADASDQDVETAHNALVEFLERAPKEVRSWAAGRTTDVDEAFALLSGPEEDLMSAAPVFAADQVGQKKTFQAPAAPAAPDSPASGNPLRTRLVWAIAPVLILAAGFGVYKMGASDVPGISGTPTNSQTTAAAAGEPTSAPVDAAKVAALTKKVASNPKDVVSLLGLGDAYFAARDYKNAALWEQKVIAVDPKNQVGLLALGAAQFNQGNEAEAKKHWLVAAGLYPNSAEVHYDLGFLYLSQKPADMARMTAEWKKVIAIDPSSEIAKTVAKHMTSAKSPSPTASAHPSAK